jgi:hypothetical protein
MAETVAPTSNSKTALTDTFRRTFSGDAPLTEKAKAFAKERPWTSAALVGIAAIATLTSLRGRAYAYLYATAVARRSVEC